MRSRRWAAAPNNAARRPSAGSPSTDQVAQAELTRRFEELCADYGMAPSRTIMASPARTDRSERRAWGPQRGCFATSCCCAAGATSSLCRLRRFSRGVRTPRRPRPQRVEIERPALKQLQSDEQPDSEEARVLVTSSSSFMLRRIFYSVPSRLISRRFNLRLYDDQLESSSAPRDPDLTAPPAAARERQARHVVDYHHIIHALRRADGARQYRLSRSTVPASRLCPCL